MFAARQSDDLSLSSFEIIVAGRPAHHFEISPFKAFSHGNAPLLNLGA
jgi:hypothetical protein